MTEGGEVRDRQPRIDAHHHVWDLSVRDQPWTSTLPTLRRSFQFSNLRPSLEQHDVEATVLVQTVCVPEETPEMLALAASCACTPSIAGVVGWVDLTAPGVTDELAQLRSGPGGEYLVGIRHQVQEEPDSDWLLRPDARRGLRVLPDHGQVYELLVRADQLASAALTVRDESGVQFVLDHAGKPDLYTNELSAWTGFMSDMARQPNIAVKLSGLTSYPALDWTLDQLRPVVRTLLDEFGPDRLMFGSDWPVCELGGGYDRTFEAMETLVQDLDASERSMIFGGTARRVYRFAP